MSEDEIIQVDDRDNEIGPIGKGAAHRAPGTLHRAISVFILNRRNELLLQRRALSKYHSGGLWSNTCCSHPSYGESTANAARRRLIEEMGIDCPLTEIHRFEYRAELPSGLVEHEYDHVFVGQSDDSPEPDENEVSAWRWIALSDLKRDIAEHPETYSFWLARCLDDVITATKSHAVPHPDIR